MVCSSAPRNTLADVTAIYPQERELIRDISRIDRYTISTPPQHHATIELS
jgi:hypothetical protein